MIRAEPIGWLNTGLPLAILAMLAVVLPNILVPAQTRSQRELAVGIAASAALLLVVGEVVFALIYAVRGIDVWAAIAEAPLATGGFFLKLSALAAMLWGPLLALMWLGLAQGVEKRRGEDRMRGRET